MPMRRWLIALFTLHFFLSVGLFAFGAIGTSATGELTQSTAIVAIDGTPDPAQGNDSLDTAADHGLTDAQPDLPEIIHELVAVVDTVQTLAAAPSPVLVKLAQPTLEGPQRPPRLS